MGTRRQAILLGAGHWKLGKLDKTYLVSTVTWKLRGKYNKIWIPNLKNGH